MWPSYEAVGVKLASLSLEHMLRLDVQFSQNTFKLTYGHWQYQTFSSSDTHGLPVGVEDNKRGKECRTPVKVR